MYGHLSGILEWPADEQEQLSHVSSFYCGPSAEDAYIDPIASVYPFCKSWVSACVPPNYNQNFYNIER